MHDTPIVLTGADVAIPQSYTYLDTSLYDGAIYYFEAVSENPIVPSRRVMLFNSSLNSEADVSFSNTTTKRVRSSSFTPNNSYPNKLVYDYLTDTTRNCYVSRIIIVQSNATKTELQIAIGTNSSGKFTAYANPSNWGNAKRKFWYYDSSKFETSGSMTVEMEAILVNSSASGTSYACIKTAGSTSAVTKGEASVTGKTITRNRNTGGIPLSNGTAYEGDFKGSASNVTATVYALRLIQRFTATISKIETVQRCGWEQSSTNSCDEQRTLVTLSSFSGTPTVLYEATGYETATDANNDVDLIDDTTNDSGTGGSSVTSAPLNYNSTTPVRIRSGSLTLTDGRRYYARGLEADSFWGNAWIIIQTISGNIHTGTISPALALTDTSTRTITNGRLVSPTINLVETMSRTTTVSRLITPALALVGLMLSGLMFAREILVNLTLNITQSTTNIINREITPLIILAVENTRTTIGERLIEPTLILIENMSRTINLNREIISNLIFIIINSASNILNREILPALTFTLNNSRSWIGARAVEIQINLTSTMTGILTALQTYTREIIVNLQLTTDSSRTLIVSRLTEATLILQNEVSRIWSGERLTDIQLILTTGMEKTINVIREILPTITLALDHTRTWIGERIMDIQVTLSSIHSGTSGIFTTITTTVTVVLNGPTGTWFLALGIVGVFGAILYITITRRK